MIEILILKMLVLLETAKGTVRSEHSLSLIQGRALCYSTTLEWLEIHTRSLQRFRYFILVITNFLRKASLLKNLKQILIQICLFLITEL